MVHSAWLSRETRSARFDFALTRTAFDGPRPATNTTRGSVTVYLLPAIDRPTLVITVPLSNEI